MSGHPVRTRALDPDGGISNVGLGRVAIYAEGDGAVVLGFEAVGVLLVGGGVDVPVGVVGGEGGCCICSSVSQVRWVFVDIK